MKDGGYFNVYRRAFRSEDHGGDPLWNEARVWSRAEAWLYLLAITAHAAHDKPLKGGRIVHLERGEFYASLRFLAKKWTWSKDKVARFLAQLTFPLSRIVRQTRASDGDTYLVVNYDYYQSERDTKRDTGETPARHRRDKREEERKEEEEKTEEGIAARSGDGPAQPPALLTFPCVGKVGEWDLAAKYVEELAEAYPNLDVTAEARKALAWIRANPKRRKTAKGMPACLVNWLNNATNRPSRGLFDVAQPATRIPARRADSTEPSGSTVRYPKGYTP